MIKNKKKSIFVIKYVLFFLCIQPIVGCVERTITINSSPPGALAKINGQEVGKTPCTFGFDYFGEYDVVLKHPTHKTLITSRRADESLWDLPVLDLLFELIPIRFKTNLEWDFTLEKNDINKKNLIQRAKKMREETIKKETGKAGK